MLGRLTAAALVLAACSDRKAAPAPPPPETGVVDEARAHPDYPTPRRAGTEDLFLVEEPDRGPLVTAIDLPDRATLTFTEHAHCEIDHTTVVCGKARAASLDLARVRVGAANGRPVLVEWMRGDHVDETVVLAYDAAGAVTQLAHLDAAGVLGWARTFTDGGTRYGSRLRDGGNGLDGCGAKALTLDAGRVVSATCLQWGGEPMRDTAGVVTEVFERDADGFVTAVVRRDYQDAPAIGQQDGVHQILYRRDAHGRVVEEHYLGVDGTPVGAVDRGGCFATRHEYAKNLRHWTICLDVADERMADEDGVAIIETSYDAGGCEISQRYLDPRGKATGVDGLHEVRREVNARCEETARRCLDRAGARVACGPAEPAEYRYTLDDRGYTIATTFVAEDGGRGVDPDYGAGELRRTVDDLGRETEESCFAWDGAAIECAETGYHRAVTTYDAAGRPVEERFFDTTGASASNLGAVIRRMTYDSYDHTIELQDLDADGQLLEVEGAAIRRNYYDDRHQLFGVALLDARGAPANYTSCYAGVDCPDRAWHAVRLRRAGDGTVVENLYFDSAGQLIETVDCARRACF